MKHPLGTPGNTWVGYVLCKGLRSCVMHVRPEGSKMLVINVNVISFASIGSCDLGKFWFYCV